MLVGLQVCMQTMGSGGSEGTDGTTFHQYTGNHQRTELILLSHIDNQSAGFFTMCSPEVQQLRTIVVY